MCSNCLKIINLLKIHLSKHLYKHSWNMLKLWSSHCKMTKIACLDRPCHLSRGLVCPGACHRLANPARRNRCRRTKCKWCWASFWTYLICAVWPKPWLVDDYKGTIQLLGYPCVETPIWLDLTRFDVLDLGHCWSNRHESSVSKRKILLKVVLKLMQVKKKIGLQSWFWGS